MYEYSPPPPIIELATALGGGGGGNDLLVSKNFAPDCLYLYFRMKRGKTLTWISCLSEPFATRVKTLRLLQY